MTFSKNMMQFSETTEICLWHALIKVPQRNSATTPISTVPLLFGLEQPVLGSGVHSTPLFGRVHWSVFSFCSFTDFQGTANAAWCDTVREVLWFSSDLTLWCHSPWQIWTAHWMRNFQTSNVSPKKLTGLFYVRLFELVITSNIQISGLKEQKCVLHVFCLTAPK